MLTFQAAVALAIVAQTSHGMKRYRPVAERPDVSFRLGVWGIVAKLNHSQRLREISLRQFCECSLVKPAFIPTSFSRRTLLQKHSTRAGMLRSNTCSATQTGIAPAYTGDDMPVSDFEAMVRSANKLGASVVRSSVGMFATANRDERYSWPYAQREAMRGAVQPENVGQYQLNPRDVFGVLSQHGYFTRKAFASKDKYNPERSMWAAYHVSSLAAGGMLYDPNVAPEEHGTFTSDIPLVSPSNKRRQLDVQNIAVPQVEILWQSHWSLVW